MPARLLESRNTRERGTPMKIARTITAGAGAAAVAAGLALSSAGAANAEPVPQLGLLGTDLHLPPVGECHGTLHYVTEDLHTPHGDVRTTFFPTGTWGTSEQCAVDFRVGPIAGPFQDVRADDGPVSVDVRLGKGLTMLAIGAVEPFAPNPGAYTWVDPFG